MRAPATKITGLYAGLFVAGPGFLLERDFRKRPRPQLFGIGHRIATAISLIAIATAGRVPPGRNGTRSEIHPTQQPATRGRRGVSESLLAAPVNGGQ